MRRKSRLGSTDWTPPWSRARPARAAIGGVLGALEAFTGGSAPADDYTLLVMKFVKSRKKAGEISGEFPAVGM